MVLETKDRLKPVRNFFSSFWSREVCFEKRCNNSSLENSRKDARGQGRVDETSEKREESIETFYKKSSLDNSRKDARGQGRADESSERRKESVEAFYKNIGRNRIKLAGLGG